MAVVEFPRKKTVSRNIDWSRISGVMKNSRIVTSAIRMTGSIAVMKEIPKDGISASVKVFVDPSALMSPAFSKAAGTSLRQKRLRTGPERRKVGMPTIMP